MHDGFGSEEMETDARVVSFFMDARAMPRGPSTEEAATELEFGAAGDTSKSCLLDRVWNSNGTRERKKWSFISILCK